MSLPFGRKKGSSWRWVILVEIVSIYPWKGCFLRVNTSLAALRVYSPEPDAILNDFTFQKKSSYACQGLIHNLWYLVVYVILNAWFWDSKPPRASGNHYLESGTAFDEMKLVVILNRLVSRYSLSLYIYDLYRCACWSPPLLGSWIFLFPVCGFQTLNTVWYWKDSSLTFSSSQHHVCIDCMIWATCDPWVSGLDVTWKEEAWINVPKVCREVWKEIVCDTYLWLFVLRAASTLAWGTGRWKTLSSFLGGIHVLRLSRLGRIEFLGLLLDGITSASVTVPHDVWPRKALMSLMRSPRQAKPNANWGFDSLGPSMLKSLSSSGVRYSLWPDFGLGDCVSLQLIGFASQLASLDCLVGIL